MFEGSGEIDYEDINLKELLSYDQGLPIAKFPILARSSGKSGLIPLTKGTTGELTGFTNGLTDEMKKLLNGDKNNMKFSRRKNDKIEFASVHNVKIDYEKSKKNNAMGLKKIEDSNEDDLYNKLPEEKGQFLVEKMPHYLGAMIRNNGMKSLNAFGAYGKSDILKLFNKRNGGYGSSFGDKQYNLKPGQYFAGQRPPDSTFQSQTSSNQIQNSQPNVIKKGINFRNIVTNNVPNNQISSNNVRQTLLRPPNAAPNTYNRLKLTNQNGNSERMYLSPSLGKVGTVNSPTIKNSNQPTSTVTRIQNNLQQQNKIPTTDNKFFVHGISMTQFKKFPKPLENSETFLNVQNNENDRNNFFITPPKEANDIPHQVKNSFNENFNLQQNNQQFLHLINENYQDTNKKNNEKMSNNIKSYGSQFNNFIINQQKSPTLEKSNLLVEQNPSQVVSNKYLPIYSDNNHQNNLKIEDFNPELLNKNINPQQYTSNDIEVSCCNGDLIYSTVSCCNSDPETKNTNNEHYHNDGINNNFIDKTNNNIYYNNFNKNNQNSEEYGDINNNIKKNKPTFKSYKPTSKSQPIYTDMENFLPLPERIGDIYSNNFGNFNS